MLIGCPECEHMVSDKADFCPNCGYPMKQPSRRYSRSRRMKLPNGFGRITEIKGKNLRKPFRAMVTTGVDASGKPIATLLKPVSYFESYNDAYQALMKYHESPYDLSNDLTMEELFDKWFEKHSKSISSSRSTGILSAWKYCESIKPIKVQTIRNRDIKALLEHAERTNDDDSKRKIPPTMVRVVRDILNGMFSYAVEYEILSSNPMPMIKNDKSAVKETKHHISYSDEEIEILWKESETNVWAELTIVQCYMGWRPSEILDIKVSRVNLTDWYILGGSKTTAGKNRIVPVHKRIRNIIRKRYDFATRNGLEYLFMINRKTIVYSMYKYGFKTMVKELPVSNDHLPHDARKHFVTMAKKYDVDEYAIKRIVGHAISDITENIYTDRSVEWLHREIAKIP